MMDQWHLPYSDRSGSGCISEFENSSDEREHEAYLEWANDRATPAEQAVPQAGASGEEDLSALANITITSLQTIPPMQQHTPTKHQITPECRCKRHAGGCSNLC